MTLNESWGWVDGDVYYKRPEEVLDLLARCAAERGNLLINIGPRPDGSLDAESHRILEALGDWMEINRESVFGTDYFTWRLMERGDDRSDWTHHGPLTARGNHLYWHLRRWKRGPLVLGGLHTQVVAVECLGLSKSLDFYQQDDRLFIGSFERGQLPCFPVLKISCASSPNVYLSAGMRIPSVAHPPYDPCPSDVLR